MKKFNTSVFLTTLLAVVVGVGVYNFGKSKMDKMKTTPPATTA